MNIMIIEDRVENKLAWTEEWGDDDGSLLEYVVRVKGARDA